jgi:hypothetical protein
MPIDMLDFTRLAGAFSDGMQHTKSDPVAPKLGLGFSIHRECDRAIRFAPNHPIPAEIDFFFLANHIKGNLEVKFIFVNLQICDMWRYRPPIAIPHRDAHPAQDFALPITDLAQITVFQEQGQWPGPQGNSIGQRLINTVIQNVF